MGQIAPIVVVVTNLEKGIRIFGAFGKFSAAVRVHLRRKPALAVKPLDFCWLFHFVAVFLWASVDFRSLHMAGYVVEGGSGMS